MILQISDDNSIILRNIIWPNYEKGQYEPVDLFLLLENGYLYITPNNVENLKVKSFKYIKGKTLKEARKISCREEFNEYEGICIDLNLPEKLNKEKLKTDKKEK